jgi:hypothetical protein
MRKDVREFIRRSKPSGSQSSRRPATTASCATASHCGKRTGCRSRCRSRPTPSAGAEPQSSNCATRHQHLAPAQRRRSPPTFRSPGFDRDTFSSAPCGCQATCTATGRNRNSRRRPVVSADDKNWAVPGSRRAANVLDRPTQPCGIGPLGPENACDQRHPGPIVAHVAVAEVACHAGGRGFESRLP